MKTVQRERARVLRRVDGRSIKEIARLLGVSRSSVSRWVRDIELTPDQRETLRLRNPIQNQQLNGTAVVSALRRQERIANQEAGRSLARRNEPLHVAGCMLYWAEGAKGRNQLQFSNSDPEMVRFFVRFLRTYFALRDEHIKITCHLFSELRGGNLRLRGSGSMFSDFPRQVFASRS